MEAENNRITQLEALAKELTDYNYYNAAAVNARMQVLLLDNCCQGCGSVW